jgi:Ca2+-binding EF-hand superfamily protein
MVGHSLYLFKQYDRNRDGVLTPDELPKHDPARMRRADRTGDGRLSHSEVAADKVYEFFEIDTDRNGVVSVQEVLAYEARLRTAGK